MQVSLSKAVYLFSKGVSVTIRTKDGDALTWNKKEGFKSLYRVILPYYHSEGDKGLTYHIGYSVTVFHRFYAG